MSLVSVPISFGELIDKITILEIKLERMSDPAKLANVRAELEMLRDIWRAAPESKQDVGEGWAALKQVNARLWVIEDDIRECERRQDFGAEFVRLARAVYFENDERARIKRALNERLGSRLVEEKSYRDYRTA